MSTTVTLRPNGIISAGSWTNTGGAGSINAATSDNSDTTYASTITQYDNLVIDFGTFSFPALSQIRSVTPRVRYTAPGANQGINAQLWDNRSSTPFGAVDLFGGSSGTQTATGGSRTTSVSSAAFAQADVDALALLLSSYLGGSGNIFELYLDVAYNQAPATPTPTAPTGTVTTTSQPTTVFPYSDPDGDLMERYWLKVFSAAQYGAAGFNPDTSAATWDSGEVLSSATSVPIGAPLTNSTTYKAYVKVADVGSSGRYSAWGAGPAFTISLDLPATPTIAATNDDPNSRTVLTVQGLDNMLSKNQASIETDTSGWVNKLNASLSQYTGGGINGTAQLAITAVGAGEVDVTTTEGAGGIAVAGSSTYIAIATLTNVTTARLVQAIINWFNASGSFISASAGSAVTESGATQISASGTSPPSAAFASIQIKINGAGAGEVHRLDVASLAPGSSTTWSRGGLTSTQKIEVQRSADGGVTWTRLTRLSPGFPASVDTNGYGLLYANNQTGGFYDYEAPRGVAVSYRARTLATDTGNALASAWSTSSSATVVLSGWWLKNIYNPAQNFNFQPAYPDEFPITYDESQGVMHPLGASYEVVLSDAVTGAHIPLQISLLSDTDFAAYQALRQSLSPMLLQASTGEQWYCRFVGTHAIARVMDGAPAASRLRSLTAQLVEIATP